METAKKEEGRRTRARKEQKEEERGKKGNEGGGGRGKEEASLTVVEVPRHLDALRSRGKFERSSVWTRVRHYVGIWGAQAARVHACAPPSDARARVCVRVRVCAAIRACWEEELYTRCPPCAAINYRVTRYGRARPTLYISRKTCRRRYLKCGFLYGFSYPRITRSNFSSTISSMRGDVFTGKINSFEIYILSKFKYF